MSSPGVRTSRSRTIAFTALTLIAMVAAIEGGAALLLGLSQGGWPSLREVATRRQAVLGDETASPHPATATNRRQTVHTFHPYLGFTRDPEAGERPPPVLEDELFFEPSEQRLVVAVLGGSVADQLTTTGSGLAPALRKVDRFSDREIEVISLAQGAFKQPQQLSLLGYLLALGAHFDLVINVDGFNEVALPATDLVPRQVFPFYPQRWDQRVGPLESAAGRAAAELRRNREQRRRLAHRFNTRPWSSSHIAAIVWQALDARATQEIASAERALLQAPAGDVSYGSHGPQRAYGSATELYQDLAGFWYRSSLQIHHLCRGQDIEYHHVLQPNQYLEGSKPITAERAAGTWLAEQPYRPAVEQGYPWLVHHGRALRDRGVGFHDLTGLFADRAELLYSDSCCHLNFLGNTLLQRAIAQRIAGSEFERPENLSDGGLALEGYDPVSYFDSGPVRGQAEITATHDGIRYRFASRANRARFLAAPESFLPRYGGWCAFGLGMDEKETGVAPERYPVDPENYEISDGRLYLFYRSPQIDGRERWRRDPERFRQRADDAWQKHRQ